MTAEHIRESFREKVGSAVDLAAEGVNRFRVFTPFLWDDGDHYAIVLKKEPGGWILSDEGHTLMHLSYFLGTKDLLKGSRRRIIDSALAAFSLEDREGELVLRIPEDAFGDALFSFAQALARVSDVRTLSRDRVRSTFLEDLRSLLTNAIPESRRTFDWYDKTNDPEERYGVDCRVNGMATPLFLYGVPSDDKARDVTI